MQQRPPSPAHLGWQALPLFALFALFVTGAACGNGEATGPDSDTGVASTEDTGTDDSLDSSSPDPVLDTRPARDTDDDSPQVDTRPWDLGSSGDGDRPDLTLDSVVPSRGSTEGGTKFALKGQGFTDQTAVYFGGREADVRLVGGDLVGETPGADTPGPVPVKVRDPATGADTLTDGFTYVAPLTFDSADPAVIPVEGAFQITIRGTGFTPETRASFGGRTALHHEFVGPETLRVVAPSHPAGSVDVRLTNRDATTLAPDAVTYVQPIDIDGVRPASGPTGGGTHATLRGRGFRADMMVTFGGKRAPLQSVNNQGTRATVEVPSHAAGLVDVAATSPSGGGDLATDAFYYRSAADAFRVASASPQEGPSSGGTRVTLVGAGLDRSGLEVRFGGTRATIRSQGTGWAVVEAPSHATGSVDIEARDGAGARSVLRDGFVYRRDLRIDSLQPGSGPASGGTTVTIDGTGFQGTSEVRFGGVVASYRVVDDSTLEATTPSHAPGTFDVTVERGGMETTAEDAFEFDQTLQVFGFSPARGSIAGNTYVLLRGLGFTGSNLGATFDGTDAQSLRKLDTQTLALRTPPHPAGNAEVRVQRGSDAAKAPGPFRYFNPTARDGGTWGSSIEGSVNIAVYTQSQRPISGAFAMLSTNASSQYTAWTDADGLATISGPDVYGPQTITVTARGYSSVTLQELDASNVTVFLNRVPVASKPGGDTGVSDTATSPVDAMDVPEIDTSDADASRDAPTFDTGTPPNPPIDASYDAIQGPDDPPPPEKGPPIFTGELTGLEKIAVVGPNEETVATVYTTKSSIRSRNPPPGSGNRLESNGTYRLRTRTGDLALVAVGGVLNTKTREFEPVRLGVKRYQTAVRGKTYQRDISLDIELDERVTFKISESPFDSGGPDIHYIRPFLDFGFEGVFGRLENARGTGSLVTADHYPELKDELSDVTVATIGGSYTERSGGGLAAPQSVALDDGIQSSGTIVPTPKLLGVPKITSPASGRKPSNGAISFRLTSRIEPDFFWVRVFQSGSRTNVWDMFAPGSSRSIQLPNFPDFSSEPKSRRPVPYPSGRLSVRIVAIRNPNARYEEFGYSDLSLFQWSAYGISFHRMAF